jgi:hypothetical protein
MNLEFNRVMGLTDNGQCRIEPQALPEQLSHIAMRT